jgi:putative DNA primase/helicase
MLALTDSSGALVGRFIVLLFPNSFYGNENIGLTNELLEELPGILNWALDGYDNLRDRGYFIQPDNAKKTIEDMETLGAPIKAFIRDCCKVGPKLEVDDDKLYNEYCTWCGKEGLKPRSKSWFGRDLNTVVPGLTVVRRGTDDRERVYQGIEIIF